MSNLGVVRTLAGLKLEDAIAALNQADWQLIGRGDWSYTFGSSGGDVAVRLTPFDPGFMLFATLQLESKLPEIITIYDIVALSGSAFLVTMERGREVSKEIAEGFISTISPGTHAFLDNLCEKGRQELRYFGGMDLHPGNILKTDRRVLTDCVYLDGPRLRQDILDDVSCVLKYHTAQELEAFCTLPFFTLGDGKAFRVALLAALEQADVLSNCVNTRN